MGCGATAKASNPGKYEHVGDKVAELAKTDQNYATPPPIPGTASQPPDIAGTRQDSAAAKAEQADSTTISVQPKAATTNQRQAEPTKPRQAAAQRPSTGGSQSRAELLTGIYKRYEAEAASAIAWDRKEALEPLVSPQNVQLLAHILGVDLAREGFLVSAAKLLLSSTLADAFRENGKVTMPNVQQCLDLFSEHRSKEGAAAPPRHEPGRPGKASCVECSSTAMCYCPDCEDTFCTDCFKKLHAKGNRSKHMRLDVGMAGFKFREADAGPEGHLPKSGGQVLNRWHAFADAQGLRFFYNFERQEAVRKIPEEEFSWQPPPPLPRMG